MTDCPDCHDLGRKLVSTVSDRDQLKKRVRSRHPSKAERRRLIRLETDAYIARQMLQNHKSVCAY